MKVYVLSQLVTEDTYIDHIILGVFFSLEKAQAEMKRLIEKYKEEILADSCIGKSMAAWLFDEKIGDDWACLFSRSLDKEVELNITAAEVE